MPNTVIALKKSATPGAAPADLANGEIAINFADGRFYYKRANGTISYIASIPQSDSFGTVNAAGTLILADTSSAVLSLLAGNNISITANALTDTITISATGNAVAAFDSSNASSAAASAAFLQANTARTHANAAHLTANAAFDQANTARTHANAAHLTANAAFDQANTARTHANTAHLTANAAFDQANTARTHANAAHLTANAAFNQANTARTVVNDTVNGTRYLMFSNGTSGIATLNVAVGLTFTPSSNTLNINGPLNAVTKSFVIPHPTKDGMILRYGSLEGPENGIYVRGKIEGKSIIDLPNYWWNLIDESTITVNLTPYGRSQDIWVQSTSSHFIHLNQPADCFFTVFAERKDVDKLVVEY